MFSTGKRVLITLFPALFMGGCGDPGNRPLSYDPPGSTNTLSRKISPQPRRTIGFNKTGVWVSNEFPGGRLSDFYRMRDSIYTAVIRPENAPVNNSPWYAFKIWSERPQTVVIRLVYRDGDHRYLPKLSRDGKTWAPIDDASYHHEEDRGRARLRLEIGPEPLWVAGQELVTSGTYTQWMDDLAKRPFVTRRVIGESTQGRPLPMLEITESPEVTRYVLVLGRQHPPEVAGAFAALSFLETIAGESDLAAAFRRQFKVWAVPLVNPDGVDNGHWRHNGAGVDLNRDWLHFNQPEVRAVREVFEPLADQPGARVYFGIDFHSQEEEAFHTLSRDLETNPPGFTDAWLDRIRVALADYEVVDEPYDLGSPVSKNWFYRTFGIPAVTFEVGDESDREMIRRLGEAAAESMMELLMNEAGAQRAQTPRDRQAARH